MTTPVLIQNRLPMAAVAGSIILHLLFFIPFLLPGKSVHMNQVTYVDLTVGEQVETAAKPEPAQPVVQQKTAEPVMQDEMTEKVEEEEEKAVPQPEVAQQVQPQKQQEQNDFVLGMSKGFFNTLGKGKTLVPDLRDYYLAMLAKVNEKWWGVDADHRKIKRDVLAMVIIARNGMLVDGRIVKSSGDPVLDDLVLQTIRAASPYPPLPESFSQDFFQAPIRLVPPLNLNLFDTAS